MDQHFWAKKHSLPKVCRILEKKSNLVELVENRRILQKNIFEKLRLLAVLDQPKKIIWIRYSDYTGSAYKDGPEIWVARPLFFVARPIFPAKLTRNGFLAMVFYKIFYNSTKNWKFSKKKNLKNPTVGSNYKMSDYIIRSNYIPDCPIELVAATRNL